MSSVASGDRDRGQAALVDALRRASEGDRVAFRLVFDHTSAKLMGVCLRILKDRDEAEDVLQEVYVSVWNRAGSFDPLRASPNTWLATIARNRAIDRLRARRPRAASVPVEEALGLADERPDGFAAAAEREDGARIHHCLSTLEAKTRDMIRSAFFDGLSHSDLAAQSGMPLGTVKSWIRRGLQRLKSCLAG